MPNFSPLSLKGGYVRSCEDRASYPVRYKNLKIQVDEIASVKSDFYYLTKSVCIRVSDDCDASKYCNCTYKFCVHPSKARATSSIALVKKRRAS